MRGIHFGKHLYAMKVEVKLFANFRDRIGSSVIKIDASTVGELLRKLIESNEELKKINFG